jgi:hypothetical protein
VDAALANSVTVSAGSITIAGIGLNPAGATEAWVAVVPW